MTIAHWPERLGDDRRRSDTWLTAYVEGRAELGAFIPADLRSGDGIIDVFWRSPVDRTWLAGALGRVRSRRADLFGNQAMHVSETLIAFGDEVREVQGPGLDAYLGGAGYKVDFPAYRIEFRAQRERHTSDLSIWANVTVTDRMCLGEAGENVGIGFSSSLMSTYLREFFHAETRQTLDISGETVSELFEAIEKEQAVR